MVNSMTGFATRRGAGAGASWTWELRSVNGRGLDLRLRLPEGIEGLEPGVRAALAARLARGSVSLSLRLVREAGAEALRVNPEALAAAVAALRATEAAAAEGGLALAPARASDLLGMRGVLEAASDETYGEALAQTLLAELPVLIDDLCAARAAEGRALARILAAQTDRIAALVEDAAAEAEARRPQQAQALAQAVAALLAEAPAADPARLEQELALIAARTDVTEEIDRLRAHVAAARALMAAKEPVGRKFDFLMQEFNREANTLCSKAQSAGLTRVGLDLKSVIDQMREQVQNVE
jgi:uncharacterized protein (TIGR00255 family)